MSKRQPSSPCLSYAHGVSAAPLSAETIGCCLQRVVADNGNHNALFTPDTTTITYDDLYGRVNSVAKGLLQLGVRKGDRVAVLSPNSAEWMTVQYAVAMIGAILVSLNPLHRFRELRHELQLCKVKVIIAVRRHRGADCAEILNAVSQSLADAAETRAVYLDNEKVPGAMTWQELCEIGVGISDEEVRSAAAAVDCDDPGAILFTSGTTGTPKGATLSHHTIVNCGIGVGDRLKLVPDDRIALPVPFHHVLGSVLGNVAALMHGSAVVLTGDTFDAKRCLAIVEEHRCTALYGVPSMFAAEVEVQKREEYDLKSLRTGVMAGAPCGDELMRDVVERLGIREMTICYGMTETPPLLQSSGLEAIEYRSAIGPLPFVECKIASATGAILPTGEIGEICARGYGVMSGYWSDRSSTDKIIDSAGWIHTGDLGVMDDGQRVRIIGRQKDMVIRGGVNLHPREIEDFLLTHRKVGEVHVVGVPDEHYGEELCAWIRLHAGEVATPGEIRQYCQGNIAPYKIPRYIFFQDTFPMTATGKVQKAVLRDLSVQRIIESAQ